jgi:hypothetical protein
MKNQKRKKLPTFPKLSFLFFFSNVEKLFVVNINDIKTQNMARK